VNEPSLRVALDCGPLLDRPTGVGRYTRELGHGLEVLGVELVRFAIALRGPRLAGGKRWRLPAAAVQTSWLQRNRPAIDSLVGDADIVHATNFVLPVAKRAPGVVTVHDLSFLRDDTFPGGERLRDLVPWSVNRAQLVITPTHAVADEVAERYGVEPDRLVVTHEGVSPLFFGAAPLPPAALEQWGVGGPFAVAVGTIEPRKNLPRLLAAWRRSGLTDRGWTLLLAGPKGWGPRLPETKGVRLTGWLGDETLPGLYAAAGFFCYPSLYEGFGLPPLEAMAAGAPVLAGAYSAAREVLGEAAVLVDPQDVDALAGALSALAGDESLRRRLSFAGKARAAVYTWERTAERTLEAYRRVVRSH
jgi:glycosyltransferase involved in cell wall biosynthesis